MYIKAPIHNFYGTPVLTKNDEGEYILEIDDYKDHSGNAVKVSEAFVQAWIHEFGTPEDLAMESFAEVPLTLNAYKAYRTQNSADWTPRDALIDILRDIDNGAVKIDALIIVHHNRETLNVGHYSGGVASEVEALGLLTYAAKGLS